MKQLTLIIATIAMVAFKGGPSKELMNENSLQSRTISFEAIHNLNVPFVHAESSNSFAILANIRSTERCIKKHLAVTRKEYKPANHSKSA